VVKTFDVVWSALADEGKCDDIGSVEYHRIKDEWHRYFEKIAMGLFIVTQANLVPKQQSPAPEWDFGDLTQ